MGQFPNTPTLATVLETNLTQQSGSNVATANSQNFFAFGLASGHTQIDGSPISFTGLCGAANTIGITLNSYTWNSSNTQASAKISLAFTESSYDFSGTGTGIFVVGNYNLTNFSGTYSSTGACADSGTWTANFSNGNFQGPPGFVQTLPLTAYPCNAGWWGGAGITNLGQNSNSPDQTFTAGFWCVSSPSSENGNQPFLGYSTNGTTVGQVEFGQGQKLYYLGNPNVTTPQVIDTFNWFVFAENPNTSNANEQLQFTMYAYNPDGTFVTQFNGTCADAPDSTGFNCN